MVSKADEIAIYEELLTRQYAAANFVKFVKYMTRDEPNFMQLAPFQERLCELLQRIYEKAGIEYASINLPFAHGKLVDDATPILTTAGWSTHGALAVGDFVFGPDGKPTQVLACSSPDVASVAVDFTDGSTIHVHPRHQWTVYDRASQVWKTIETQKLKDAARLRYDSHCRFSVARTEPLEFAAKDVAVPPYVLGAWLGDGHSHGRSLVYTTAYIANLRPALERYGLSGNKHVPEAYLFGSESQRRELLAGLIDTDGHVSQRTGCVRLINTNRRLVDAVIFLARSLGWSVHVSEVAPCTSSSGIAGKKTCWSVGFYPDHLPTRLPYKRVLFNPKHRKRGIIAVRDVRPSSGKCIQVDRPDGLYLVGETLIPTHNSTIVNKLFPAWVLGRNPNLRVLTISHKKEMADDFSRDTREYIASDAYKRVFPNTRLDPDSYAIGKWRVHKNRGFYQSAGITSGIQGKRFDLIIADDLIGNQEDAFSQLVRDKVARAFFVDVMSRLDPRPLGACVLVASRQHIDDPTGRIIEFNKNEEGERWSIFNFPAIAETNDILGRKPGEPLWPERFPLSKLNAIRKSGRFPAAQWSANYQQSPVPEGGTILKRDYWRHWTGRKLPDFVHTVLSIDCAFKEKQTSDYSAATLWGVFRPERPKLTWIDRVEMIRESKDTTDTDLAYEFGLPPSTIRRIRAGDDVPQPHYDWFDFGLNGERRYLSDKAPLHLMLIDGWQERLSFPDLRRKVLAYREKWKPDIVLIEDKASGQSLIQELAEAGVMAHPFNPGREDKVFRAHMVEGIFEQGLVFAVGKRVDDEHGYRRSATEFAPSSEMVVHECEVFPHGVHDDIADTVVQAVNYLRRFDAFQLPDDLDDHEDEATPMRVHFGLVDQAA